MSFSTCRTYTAGIIRRHASSSASHRSLPDAKMRALISLYHQTDTFITPENLSQRIDDAFVPQDRLDNKLGRKTISMRDLSSALTEQRKAPKAIEWDDETLMKREVAFNMNWSSLKTARELKVVEALYGVNATQVGEVLPGLEIVEEAAKSNTIPHAMTQEEVADFRGGTV